jgi:hypothetical protein
MAEQVNATAPKIRNPILMRIAKAQASNGGNYIRDGIYTFCVAKIILDQKQNGNMFIVEFKVLESQNIPGIVDEKTGKPVLANPVGTMCSMALNLDTNKSAVGNAKAFVLALLGEDEANVTDEEFEEALGHLIDKDQPARGMKIANETFRKAIKGGANAGKPYVGNRWQNIDETAEQIAARRAWLDGVDASAAAAGGQTTATA